MHIHILGICGTFMGGMCLGSLLLSRIVSRSAHPLRVYAALEGLIGVLGLLVGISFLFSGIDLLAFSASFHRRDP